MNDFQDIHDIVRELNAALGPTLVAGCLGRRTGGAPSGGRRPMVPSLAQKRRAG
jgi:hypothetical protein